MKARIVKNNELIQLLLSNGDIRSLTIRDAKEFLAVCLGEKFLKNDYWPHSITMEEWSGETLAIVTDDNTLEIYDKAFISEIFEDTLIEYISLNEFAAIHGKNPIYTRKLCQDGKIKGAKKIEKQWIVPENAEYPGDGRFSSNE